MCTGTVGLRLPIPADGGQELPQGAPWISLGDQFLWESADLPLTMEGDPGHPVQVQRPLLPDYCYPALMGRLEDASGSSDSP